MGCIVHQTAATPRQLWKRTMEHKIVICANRLTDDSLVYDVRFRDISIPAVTERDAISLADKIAAAINDHSNDTAKALFRWHVTSD
jgi:hypothetical protein